MASKKQIDIVCDKTTCTVTVPKAYNLLLDNGRTLRIKEGVQELEPEVAEHWYSKANGVVIYKGIS
jgi:hypothetical protein